jgi:hypothetical protein
VAAGLTKGVAIVTGGAGGLGLAVARLIEATGGIMLAGEGAIAIWNNITPDGRAEFYEWHLREHMPERVGIPGFRRGRRYIAATADTSPEFFTLYEADSPQVLVGQDYAARLNAPTAWTKRATQAFRDTSRAVTRVAASHGPGPGGIMLTLRFDAAAGRAAELQGALAHRILPGLAAAPRVTGAHLCLTDAGASAARSAESRERTDILAAPNLVVLVEGCAVDALTAAAETVLSADALTAIGAAPPVVRGYYRLEHERGKSAFGAG